MTVEQSSWISIQLSWYLKFKFSFHKTVLYQNIMKMLLTWKSSCRAFNRLFFHYQNSKVQHTRTLHALLLYCLFWSHTYLVPFIQYCRTLSPPVYWCYCLINSCCLQQNYRLTFYSCCSRSQASSPLPSSTSSPSSLDAFRAVSRLNCFVSHTILKIHSSLVFTTV